LAQKKTTELDNINDTNRAQLTAGSEYYRVQEVRYSSFCYFSCYEDTVESLPENVGRLDLPESGGKGTWYIADSPGGAWREIIGRRPVITLDDILSRNRLNIKPAITIDAIADTTRGGAWLSRALYREDTLDVARRLEQQGCRGIKYRLNLSVGGCGYALFGPAGGTDPLAARLGRWSRSSMPAVEDPVVWDFLREQRAEGQLIILRRLPDGPGVSLRPPP
jgi:hypothetical protein